jgi:hypothetical protein
MHMWGTALEYFRTGGDSHPGGRYRVDVVHEIHEFW